METSSAVLCFSFVLLMAATTLTSGAGVLGLGHQVAVETGGAPALPPFVNGGLLGGRGAASFTQDMLRGFVERGKDPRKNPLTQSANAPLTCDPPCTQRHCCLLKPGETTPTCRQLRYSGRSCYWHHCAENKNLPSLTYAIHANGCPCNLGMCCLGSEVGSAFRGVCTFL